MLDARRLPALFMLLLGAAVMFGWAFQIRVLTQVLPTLTSMVFNTALCFLLFGYALLLPRSELQAPRPLALGLALAVLALVQLNLLQIFGGLTLGIDAPGLHAWIGDGNPKPGRMALPTSMAFTFASAALLLLGGGLRPSPGQQVAGRLLTGLLGLIGLLSLIGYAMHLEQLYSWYAFSRMALHTAVGMCLLATALWLAWDLRCGRIVRDEESRIIGLAAVMLVSVSLLTGVIGFSIFRNAYQRALHEGLTLAYDARTQLIATTLELRSTRAGVVASRPELIAQLRTLASEPGNGAARAALDRDLESFLPLGFERFSLLAADGRLLTRIGTPETANSLEVPLQAGVAGRYSLLWRQGWVLRARHSLRDADAELGSLVSEQPLPNLRAAIMDLGEVAGARGDFQLCAPQAAGLVCFPSRLHPEPWIVPGSQSAADAGDGGGTAGAVQRIDDAGSGSSTIMASGPLAATGLTTTMRLSVEEFYGPLRRRVAAGCMLVALLGAAGVLLLRQRVHPLIGQLAYMEGRHRAVIDSLQEGMALLDHDSRVLSCNPAGQRLLGYTGIDLRGVSALDPRWRAVNPDGSPLPNIEFPTIRTMATSQPLTDVVLGLYLPDGSLRWFNFDTAPVVNAAGDGRRGVIASFTDITERREAEEALRQSEVRYRSLVDGLADGVIGIDAQGLVHSFSPAAVRMFGIDAAEIIGRSLTLVMPERLRGAGAADFGRFAGDETLHAAGQRREAVGQRRDGKEFPIAIALSLASGSGRGRFVALVSDLTERKRAELAVAEAYRRVHSMIESAPFSIITSDADGIIDGVNAAAERLTQHAAAELIGGTVEPIHDRDEVIARAAELTREYGRSVEPGLEVFTHLARRGVTEDREWTYVRKDGSRVPVQLAVSALRDTDDSIVGYMGIAYDISERKRREDYTHHIANHDFLTGLPMRSLLGDRLEVALARARRGQLKVGVMVLDLDHFKRINDSLGHHIGDDLLRTVAGRLKSCVRAADTVARLGGDEFVLVLPDVNALADVERVARDIISSISAAVVIDSHELHVTPSIGIALFPDHADTAHGLLRDADTAMYRAKAGGRRSYHVFTPDMERAASARLELENALRRALERQELQVHYQPQIGLGEGRVIGMEALLRWTDATLGVISPAQFIPVAEESGLILPLGEWVLRTACRDARQLQLRTGQPLRLAVNLSPQQLVQKNLIGVITRALVDSGLAPGDLELEITEGVLMEQTALAIERLAQIRALGVSIAIDDFGTGFSSLAYVTRFPIDTLKIDRSFVAKITEGSRDAAVAQAIIALALSLDIKVVAEGVETAAQLAFLRERCCDRAQGYLFGKAISNDKFSVQGFHFGKACSAAEFETRFAALCASSEASVRALIL
ncbi:MAG: hypothetical protein NVS9B10_26990 [Nevskia sp.]